jgi:hypothetical protein
MNIKMSTMQGNEDEACAKAHTAAGHAGGAKRNAPMKTATSALAVYAAVPNA